MNVIEKVFGTHSEREIKKDLKLLWIKSSPLRPQIAGF